MTFNSATFSGFEAPPDLAKVAGPDQGVGAYIFKGGGTGSGYCPFFCGRRSTSIFCVVGFHSATFPALGALCVPAMCRRRKAYTFHHVHWREVPLADSHQWQISAGASLEPELSMFMATAADRPRDDVWRNLPCSLVRTSGLSICTIQDCHRCQPAVFFNQGFYHRS